MDKFWELLKSSVLVQGTVTLIVVLAVVYMYVTGQEVPKELSGIVMLILGFYFGSKSQNTIIKREKDREVNSNQHSNR